MQKYPICRIEVFPKSVTILIVLMFSRRLEDRIRELCAKTLRLSDVDLDSTLDELREAVQMESERIRQPLWDERRSA
jgi:hypothetical protein